MIKTTVYLPDALKKQLESIAESEDRSEADVIREAIANAVSFRTPPEPRVPLSGKGLGNPSLSERVDEFLEGFGE